MITRDRAKERYTESRKIAMQLWYDIKAYLDRVDSFEHWNSCLRNNNQLGFKLKHIR